MDVDTERIVRVLGDERVGWPEWEGISRRYRLGPGWEIGLAKPPEVDPFLFFTQQHVALALIEKHLQEWLAARDFFVNGFADYLAVLLEAVEDVLAEE